MAGNADGKHVSSLLRWYRLNVQNWIWCAVRTLPSFIAFFSHSMNRFKKNRSKSAAFSILASITVWACFSNLSAFFLLKILYGSLEWWITFRRRFFIHRLQFGFSFIWILGSYLSWCACMCEHKCWTTKAVMQPKSDII